MPLPTGRSPSPSSRTHRIVRRLAQCLLGLIALAALSVGVGWLVLRASLPQLAGGRRLAGLAAPVRIERDALGVPAIHAANALDAMRALGFLHAQERFFQMDLLRRKSAGELAELFGRAALGADREARRHRFRSVAERAWQALPERQQAWIEAYTAGVNAGLQALGSRPWEYHLLRTKPAPWQATDTLLVVHTMWLDLQDEEGRYERTLDAVRTSLGDAGFRALAPLGDSHDAPLDGSPPPPPILPPPVRQAADGGAVVPREPVPGSNAFAVAGRLASGGAALVASDMHLGLAVPNVWYRAELDYPDALGRPRRLAGVTLPGVPNLTVGSNGRVAWAFTNSYIDTVDVVPLEVDESGGRYRTPDGWQRFEEHAETIRVKGSAPEQMTVRWTRWGPVVQEPAGGRALAVAWNAHDPSALNFAGLALLEAGSVREAISIMHRAGMPNQNLIVADAAGEVAWTVAGRVPARAAGFDGLHPGDWGAGTAGWTGWLRDAEVPAVVQPAEGLIWSANHRHVGGEALRRIGDNGYDHGYRAGEIRDRLRELVAKGGGITPRDLVAIQLDDGMPHLLPWRELLVATLKDSPDPVRREMAGLAGAWTGRAEPDSAGYRLIREFRNEATPRVLAPFIAKAKQAYPRFNTGKLHTEDLVLRLLREQPADRLDPRYASWGALLEDSVNAVQAKMAEAGSSPQDFTWGKVNRLEMRHPLSRFLPRVLGRWLDMPAVPLPGDADSPRNQTPRHGASERLVVAPGREEEGLFQMPGGQSGHPLSPYYRAGHDAWVKGEPLPLLPGAARHRLELIPR